MAAVLIKVITAQLFREPEHEGAATIALPTQWSSKSLLDEWSRKSNGFTGPRRWRRLQVADNLNRSPRRRMAIQAQINFHTHAQGAGDIDEGSQRGIDLVPAE